VIALLALALVATSFLLQAHIDLNLIDEGYLWYGAIAVTKGQVPIRDFASYDPARYYWVAAWLRLLDRGIIPVRIACAVFNAGGILCGLLVVRRLTRSWWVLAAVGALLTLWLFPAFMLNHTIALAAVYVAVLLIERPSLARHLLAGAFVGFATFFARNLGLYALVSFGALIVLIWWKLDPRDLTRRGLAWGAGIVLGYAPALVMFAVVPGFWTATVSAARDIVERGTTNLARPIPWPWTEPSLWGVAVGAFFVLVPLCYALLAGWIAAASGDALRRRAVLVAATMTGIPYLQYAFSRADIEHLAMSIHPFLLALVALPFGVSRRWRAPAAALVAAVAGVSLVAVGEVSPFYQRATAPAGYYVPTRLGRWTIWMPWPEANFIRGTIQFNETMVRSDEGFLVIPHLGPGLYALLDRTSPLFQTYFLFPTPEPRQRQMIAELERNRVNWILFEDVRTDGRDELRFESTHRLMWEYIRTHFDVFPVDGLPPKTTLWRRKTASTS